MLHSQKVYYISNLILGSLILSFYAVMAFTEHYPCLTKSGTNISKGFQLAFKLGFFIHIADFANIGIFDYLIRLMVNADIEAKGIVMSKTIMMETVYYVMEWGFRCAILLVTIL